MFLTLWNRPDRIYYQFNKHRGITCDVIQMVLNYESGNKGSSHKQVTRESTPEEVRAGGRFGIGRIWEKVRSKGCFRRGTVSAKGKCGIQADRRLTSLPTGGYT